MELSKTDIKLSILSSVSQTNIHDAQISPPSSPLHEKDNVGIERRLTFEDWVKEKFTGKECVFYIPSKTEPKICKCGRAISNHFGQNDIDDFLDGKRVTSDKEWNSKTHTKRLGVAYFGGVEFASDDFDETALEVISTDVAQYLRLPDDIPACDVLVWMEQVWKLKRPKLVLSFHGGHENFNIPSQLQSRFHSGLMEILQTAETWLFTDGTNVGLSELIGSIFSTYQMTFTHKKGACVGMTTWGAINGKMKLSYESEDSYVKSNEYKRYDTPHPSVSDHIRADYLDKNHSHLLLVDDGSSGIHGRANKIRTKLFELLSSKEEDQNVPVVMVLVEGGLPIVNDIHNGLTSTPKTPVVVVRDSGRLADVFVKLIEYQEERHHQSLQLRGQMIRNLIQQLLTDNIKNLDQYQDTLDLYVEKIKTCIEEHQKCIIIYDHNEGSGALQQSILFAYKALHPDSYGEHLRINELAILWEEADMVKMSKIEESDKSKMFKKALIHNRVESVKLLLESGINLKKFLERYPIQKLYMKAFCKGSLVMKLLMTDDEIKRTRVSNEAKNDLFDMRIIHRIAMRMTDEDYSKENMNSGEHPLTVLLIWAIFANQPEMGRCLLNFCTNSPMVTALVMSRIYKYISKQKVFQGEMMHDAMAERDYFANFAVDLLSLYSKTNEDLGRECLTMSHSLWGYKDAMLLGVNMMFQKFIAQQLVQKILKDIWRGLYNEHKVMAHQRLIWERRRNINSSSKNIYQLTSNDEKNVKYKQSVRYNSINEENSNLQTRPRRLRTMLSRMVSGFLYFFYVPRGKFCLNLFIYLIFVGLFSYVVVSKITSTDHSFEECFIFGMVFTYFLDEMRQIAIVKKKTGSQKFRNWSKSIWNILDALSILLFTVGFSLRYHSKTLTFGRVIYAINIVVWYIKIFQFYRVSGTLGPYVVMIWRMTRYLLTFIMVLLVAVVAYGIFQHVLLFPYDIAGWKVLFKMFFRPYTIIFGEVGIDHELQKNETIFGSSKHSNYTETVSIIGMCVYVMVSNILLINLVIAVFNNIYTITAENADTIWKFERYDMIMEFQEKPKLPPPFSIFENIFILCKLGTRKMMCSCFPTKSVSKGQYTQKALISEILEFERRCMKMYLYKQSEANEDSIMKITRNLKRRLDSNSKLLKKMSETINNLLQSGYPIHDEPYSSNQLRRPRVISSSSITECDPITLTNISNKNHKRRVKNEHK